jgi:hypothetical protein
MIIIALAFPATDDFLLGKEKGGPFQAAFANH